MEVMTPEKARAEALVRLAEMLSADLLPEEMRGQVARILAAARCDWCGETDDPEMGGPVSVDPDGYGRFHPGCGGRW